ncbi:unnamed protein product [Brassica rapa subsp. narinosa]|uniref:(rape) hypothetical protein n=2 Tax=Brassica TaxID=3705 RepID=A0A816X5Q3_BRANA|nr:unnamed protein product [Brassica napus]
MSVKTLEMKMHMHTFLSWKLDPRVSALVESTCFRWVLKFKNGLYRQDSNLLIALASKYDESKDHFVIGNPKMDIDFGLEDVSGYESQNINATIMEHFKINEEKAESLMMNSGNSIDLSRLKFEFEMVPQEEDIDLEPYFKAYLLFFVGRSHSPKQQQLLFSHVPTTAWIECCQPLCLGSSYVGEYGRISRKSEESWEIHKLMWFFVRFHSKIFKKQKVFALERFPCLRERCGSSPLYSLPSVFPLILGWMEALCKPNKDMKNVKSVEYYKKKLQDMKEQDGPSDYRDSMCESTHGDNSTNAHSSEKEQPSPSAHKNDNEDYVTVEPELPELHVTFLINRDSTCESTHGDNSKNAHSSEKEQPSPSSHNNDNGLSNCGAGAAGATGDVYSLFLAQMTVELPLLSCASNSLIILQYLLEDICYPSRNDPNFVEVHLKDLEFLAPQKFLTSPVMNFYIRFLQKQVPSADQTSEDFHFFNTYFYQKLCDALTHKGNDKEAFWIKFRNWWKSSDIFQYEWNYLKQGDYSLDLPVSKQIWENFPHRINNVDIEVRLLPS